ncbi:MAG: hypothetical protein QHC79_14935 [Pseudosphingobacterium sp.]|nr:hypothetical protein [Pseudosphingobacterium sp.]
MSNLANFYALHFENSAENQYFGVNGEYTDQVNKTFSDLKRFWNIRSINVIKVASHGALFRHKASTT